ncbi:prepilin-type N-terminal cleavage/methylation domain-containing protein [Alteromonas sp. 14N.309.X.WAT.G.H12]|uniref:prepilin-type N-terminal cleavage/methylation domain-containing protein n=1 Tax=Alteromonas sp. 14N.309.X.WAT.G.H12 TaxID=3120824 RepID=UPI002FD24F2B
MLVRSDGFTLIELMIALTLGLAVLAGSASLTASIYHSQRMLLNGLLMEQEVNRITALITYHLSASGFHGDARNVLFSEKKKAHTFVVSYEVSQHPDEFPQSCLLFAFDANNNGVLDTSPGDERKGFRLRDNALEMRIDGKTCSQTGWQDLTQSSLVSVKELTFTQSSYDHGISLHIDLTLALTTQPQIMRTTHFSTVLPYGD